ncbi:MAG: hypothetical protein PHN89_05215 [Candidatus Pacebacteria bacterium]|nr:hypothetical protein [Candidatus Paceibacterota bacterium]
MLERKLEINGNGKFNRAQFKFKAEVDEHWFRSCIENTEKDLFMTVTSPINNTVRRVAVAILDKAWSANNQLER